MTDRLKGWLFVEGPERALGEFEYVLHADHVTLWTIPGVSDHVGFLRLQNENQPFSLQLGDGQRLALIVREVKPSGDRFEVAGRLAKQDPSTAPQSTE